MRLWKATGVVCAAGIAVLLCAGPAFAHVTVNPKTATGGSYSELTFRAPNESAKASFVKLTVYLPAAHPLGSVSTRAIDGWTVSTTTANLAKPITTDDGTVTEYTNSITWTATAGGVEPGQYQNFDVSVGPLPADGTMTFTADQTYSDGSVVKWDEPTKPGAAEPDHPAPVLTLTAASATDASATSSGATASAKSSSDTTARWLAVAALAVAVLAAAAALLRPGRTRD